MLFFTMATAIILKGLRTAAKTKRESRERKMKMGKANRLG
jgi:hypothetical protein